MDFKKFIQNQGLSNFPIGLVGCRNLDHFSDSCDYDLMIIDERSSNDEIVSFENKRIPYYV